MKLSSPGHPQSPTWLLLALLVALSGCSKRDPIVFNLERIDASGNAVTDTAPYEQAPWACVHDLRTNLTWEVKTVQPGLHGADNTYTWFYPDQSDVYNRGDAGKPDGGSCTGSKCDTSGYVAAVNEAGLCGHRDWRVPTTEELGSIINPSIRPPGPSLSTEFFPNTRSADYWTSTTYRFYAPGAWTWSFLHGLDRVDNKTEAKHIRLVRGTASVRPEPPRGPKN
ncbi:MAG: DUF1566 domain-containing protein [Rhodocyclaceae bacterium]|jgi:hypothetical protein|nr:DUF1566 domain-containing protein [Rhodocyclaceae bacterium]MCL4757032.1 DUF1566 domain-containing protein [Rhodocyclaceae bacterium]